MDEPDDLLPALADPVAEFKDVLALARGETARRLRSPKLRAKIPSGTLLTFVLNATKLVAGIEDRTPAEREQVRATHVLTVFTDKGIPDERQADLLQAFILEVGAERATELGLTAALDILVGQRQAGNRLAIEGEVVDVEQD